MKKFGIAAAPLCMALILSGCAAASAGLYGPDPADMPETGVADTSVTDTSVTDTAIPAAGAAEMVQQPDSAGRYIPYSGSGPLLAQNDYGTLLPYVGGALNLEDGVTLPLYGLTTADGQAVTDAVYTGVKRHGDFLLLESAAYTQDGYGEVLDTYTVSAAAADGRWVMDAGDWVQWLCVEGVLAAAKEDGSVLVLNPDGTTSAEFSRDALEPYLGPDYVWGRRADGYAQGGELVWAGGSLLTVAFYDETSPDYWRYGCFMDMETGTISGTAPAGWTAENGWGDLEETPEFVGYEWPDRVEDFITGIVYYCGARTGAQSCDLLNPDGTVVLADFFTASPLQWEPFLAGGLVGLVEENTFRYVRMDTGETVFRCELVSRYEGTNPL